MTKLSSRATFEPRGRDAEIVYSIVNTPLGRVMIAGTDRGICFIALGKSERELERELASDFPEALRRRDDDTMRPCANALAEYLGGRAPMPDLPLDLRATPFQLRVWNELRAIPLGMTRTYGEIAKRIGRPKASRAVGAAVGANPVSILIPCHRAVAFDGSLHNYRWGIERKRRLLVLEGALV